MSASIRAIGRAVSAVVLVTVGGFYLAITSPVAVAQNPSLLNVTALHWLPETAPSARAHTLAAALVLADPNSEPEVFDQQWQMQRNRLNALSSEAWVSSHLADGRWGYWAGITQENIGPEEIRSPSPGRMAWTDVSLESAEHNVYLWQALMARSVPDVWGQQTNLEAYFGPLLDRFEQADAADQAHARAQARRIMRMQDARSEETRQTIQGSVVLAEAQFQWSRGHHLESAWLLLEGLMWIAERRDQENARFYANWLDSLSESSVRALRSIDINFPVIMALLMDSANHLSMDPPERLAAQQKLASVYTRLALFVPTPNSYLDQPVRDQMQALQTACGSSVDLSETARRECLSQISQAMLEDLSSEELVGATGPLSEEFLARELDLVSWQRARYLDSYVNWVLSGQCGAPNWSNTLEWNLAGHWLFGLTSRDLAESSTVGLDLWPLLLKQVGDLSQSTRQWMDCIAGMGDERVDLVSRLLAIQADELDQLEGHIQQASDNFYSEVMRTGADINLDEPLTPQTAYRNRTLRVGPCDLANACGSRVELPVDEALLALVPEGYWLAEQLRLGEVSFCYDEVRWVDRKQSPARQGHSGVANYTGRLSIDLKVEFNRAEDQSEVILAKRLVSGERKNYFFGSVEPSNLDIDCPHGREGQPIASELQADASGLVPSRLTYFTSVPTPTSAYLLSQWPSWRARLGAEVESINGMTQADDELEVIETADNANILIEAENMRLALVDRRERALATRLANIEVNENDILAQSMREVSMISRLLRRVMELHYSIIIRQDDRIRAYLAGDAGLLTEEDIRLSRDQGLPMSEIADLGRARLSRFREDWLQWPLTIRERGYGIPELNWTEIMIHAREGDGPPADQFSEPVALDGR